MSFEEVYEAHFSYVFRTLRRLGVREADASDAAQDVFMVVHRRLPEFEGRAKMTTWLFRICRHTASDWRRSARVRHESQASADMPEPTEKGPDAAAQLARRQELQLVEAILDELPEEQREVFILFELEEMEGDEIADVLTLPVGTVRSRLRLAREAFQRNVQRRQSADRFQETQARGRTP
jgi:RNA polymerase sigma-70 factor (ECF subfamily)